MELSDLFSPGSKLSEVPISFHGMTVMEWQRADIHRQCSEYLATLDPNEAPLSKKKIWTPRDSYGLKGI